MENNCTRIFFFFLTGSNSDSPAGMSLEEVREFERELQEQTNNKVKCTQDGTGRLQKDGWGEGREERQNKWGDRMKE